MKKNGSWLIGALLPLLLNGQAGSLPSERASLGYITPRHSREIENSPWGIQAGTLEEDVLEKAAAIGVKWTRLSASWPSIEQEKQQYSWESTDRAFYAALSKGITPFVILGGGHPMYSPSSTYDDPALAEIYGSKPGPPTANPEAMAAWLRFVRATVERYRDRIRYWEIWNEPNHRNYWGAEPNAREYGRLLRETAALIRSIQPEARIIGGSTAELDPEFTEGFLSDGVAPLIDIITYHNYGPIPETRIYKAIEVLAVIRKYNPNIVLWQGECGYPSHSSTRDYRGNAPWGLNIQAKWLLRQAFTDVFFCQARLSNYFKLVDNGDRAEQPQRSFLTSIDSLLGFPERGGSRVKTVGVNEKCLLTNPSRTPKPAYFAYQHLCGLMDGSYQITPLNHRITIQNEGMFYGIGAADDAFPSVPLLASFRNQKGQYLVAYWLPWHPQEYTPEPALIDLSVQPGTFRDPVLADLLTGEVLELGPIEKNAEKWIIRHLPLSDYPMVILERTAVRLRPQPVSRE